MYIYNFCTLWLWATYISHFIESPILFGLYTLYIPLHTTAAKKIKYPKEVKKTSQGDANELKQGSRNLGGRGGGLQFYIWAEIEANLFH